VQFHPAAFRNRRRGVSTWIHPPCSLLSLTLGAELQAEGIVQGRRLDLSPPALHLKNPETPSLSFPLAPIYYNCFLESILQTFANKIPVQ